MSAITDPDVLSVEREDALLRGAPWRRFVVLGDSIAKGLGEVAPGYGPEPWAERVARALRRQQPELAYRNLGQPDLRAAEVRATQLDAALDFRPDLAAVVCGGNDLLDERFDGEGVEEQLDALIGAFAGADVVAFTMFAITRALKMPPELGGELESRLTELHERTRAVAGRHGALLVDLERHPASADAGIFSSDFRHANTRGHAIVASLTVARLGRELARRNGGFGAGT